jgi:hypothetical protein
MDVLLTETWQMVASGMIEETLNTLNAIPARDTRAVLESQGSLQGWFRVRAAVPFGFAPSVEAINDCLRYIENIRYAPALSATYIKPTNARVENGTTLAADAPSEPFQLYVYSWNYVQFNLLGPLSENNQPGAGVYVIVPESQSQKGVPSLFLSIA